MRERKGRGARKGAVAVHELRGGERERRVRERKGRREGERERGGERETSEREKEGCS